MFATATLILVTSLTIVNSYASPNDTHSNARSFNGRYFADSYLKPVDIGASLLKMQCGDYRFPNCAPLLSPVYRRKDEDYSEFTNFNPSIVHATGSFSKSGVRAFPAAAFIAAKRLRLNQCGRLNATFTSQDPLWGGVAIQLLDDRFHQLAETYIQACPVDRVGLITPITNETSFEGPNIWMQDLNVFPRRDGTGCGLLAGEDTRLFHRFGEIWILNNCYDYTCKVHPVALVGNLAWVS
jgi:hypothetical protein